MDLSIITAPRAKKNCKLKQSPPLPLIKDSKNEIRKFAGHFNGYSVVIEGDGEDVKNLISMGYFGKANLSRSYPVLKQQKPEILRKRVFENRKKWGNSQNFRPEKVIVVPDSDSDSNENYFVDLKPQFELDRSGINEKLYLSLEEAFFLSGPLDCLNIFHDNKLLQLQDAWKLFQASDKHFVHNYIVYYHFRAKNWVVKTGIKFGADFLLYKQGPPFYHASYAVIINIVDENFKIIQDFRRRSTDMVSLMGLNRLCETAGKELLVCEVILPDENSTETISFKDLNRFKIREVLMKRWLPAQERHNLEDF